MAILNEQLTTSLAPAQAFAFMADFANSVIWDPGVVSSVRIDDGPVGIGARYRLGVKMAGRTASMDYVVTAWEPDRRVVLEGSGSGVIAVDEIRFEPTPEGTRIHYTADIRFRGLLRLAAPLAGGAFARIARDARDGMQRALDQRATGA